LEVSVKELGVNELGVCQPWCVSTLVCVNLGVCQPWCVSTLVCVNLGVNLCLNTVLVWDRSTFCLNTFV